MQIDRLLDDVRNVFKLAERQPTALRAFSVTVGGVVFMLSCLAILSLSSCSLGL